MKLWLSLLPLLLLGCAAPAQRLSTPVSLFADQRFAPPSRPILVEDIFALSEPMQKYADTTLADRVRASGPRRGLFEAIQGELRVDYDTTLTRNAAQAFEARSGNCLSLVILTAAFAKQLGIGVRFQRVFGHDSWSRSGGIAFLSDHVNLTLGPRGRQGPLDSDAGLALTIDFLPPDQLGTQSTRSISEQTVIAMYMNNRAAESLQQAQIVDAYWWARAAIHTEPMFLSAYNTLGLVYRHAGFLQEAEQTFQHALLLEPNNSLVLTNLAHLLRERGRPAEAGVLQQRLAAIEPYPPFYFVNRGLAAMDAKDFLAAKKLFEKEIQRTPYDPELHFAIAVNALNLGEIRLARKHMAMALENSTTDHNQKIYAAKLDQIRTLRMN